MSNNGCPGRCIFCDQKKIAGEESLKLPEVSSSISAWLNRKREDSSLVEVAFYGGSFTGLTLAQQERLLKSAISFVQSGAVHKLRISTRPDGIDAENLVLLKKYGVSTVELGIQSMDPDVLKLSNRGYSVESVYDAFKKLRTFGFQIGAQLMPGLPGDTEKKHNLTARHIVSLKPDFARIYPAVVVQGTPLAALFNKNQYRPLSLETAVEWSSTMYTLFEKNDIPVIRMGLQSTSLLDSGGVVAGPYHPAFGQLVKSRVALSVLRGVLKNKTELSGDVLFFVAPREVSNYVGQKRENVVKLSRELNQNIAIKSSESILPGEIGVGRKTGVEYIEKGFNFH
ncbi:MAG: elongator complex protein 3 [Nitrospinota bacterium]